MKIYKVRSPVHVKASMCYALENTYGTFVSVFFVTYDCLICIRNMVDNITCSASAKVFLVEVFFMIAGRPRFMDTEQWRSTWRKVQLFCTSRQYFDQGATLENMPFPTGVISFLQSEPFTLDEMQ